MKQLFFWSDISLTKEQLIRSSDNPTNTVTGRFEN